jgi:hypothetical protein
LGSRCERNRATGHGAAVPGDLDLVVGDVQVGALVDVMLLELLAAGQADGDCSGLVV